MSYLPGLACCLVRAGDTFVTAVQVTPLNNVADCVQLLRHLTEVKVEAPLWRRNRTHLMLEGATFHPDGSGCGTLSIDAYVRSVGLRANQLVTVPGGGDFGIDKVYSAPEQVALEVHKAGGSTRALQGHSASSELPLLAEANEDRCALYERTRAQ
jgi:hypothetical protein